MKIQNLIRNDEIKQVVFITDQPVPMGMASTNRLLSLARGLSEQNICTRIIVINPTEQKDFVYNSKIRGSYRKINYSYICGWTIIPKNKAIKLLILIWGFIKLWFVIIKLYKKERISAIIMLHTWSIYPLWIYPLTRILRITFIQERNEYPFFDHIKYSLLRKIDLKVYLNVVLKLFDGLILITYELEKFYSMYTHKKARLKVILMTVETERFEKIPKLTCQRYIAYVGDLRGDKDGVPILLESFGIIAKNYPDLKLYMIADSSDQTNLKKLKKLIDRWDITDQVVFTGRVNRDDIPGYICNAQLLVLARPANRQAQGGFPTKLGEYLATGNPVVVTGVGEIPLHLTDGENAFIAEPNNPQAFADKLTEALEDENRAMEIGRKGRIVALEKFNYSVQGRELIKFIKSL